MRLAFDARYLDAGFGSGIGTYSLNLLRALTCADRGLELLLVRGSRRKLDALHGLDRLDGRIAELWFPFPPNSPATWLALGALLARERFDLYHAPFSVVPRGLRRPLVATVHDIMWLVNPRFNSRSRLVRAVAGPFYRAAIDACMSSATRVLAVSEATRRAMAEHAPWHATKIRVTPNGIDRDKIRPLADGEAARAIAHLVSPRTLLVLTVGDASPHKNHANAVRGYMRAFGARADWRMVLVRRFLRLDPEMHALLREPAVAERVIALPHVPAATLNALYHAARIYLHPSYYEGFGIPLLEAMAARIPVVTSSVSSLPEVAGDAALLVDPADPEAIATALLRLDADEALRARLIAAGERRLELFTWERCAKRTLEAYREALGAGSC